MTIAGFVALGAGSASAAGPAALIPTAPHIAPPVLNTAAALSTPQARSARAASQTAFRGESALGALGTAQTSFPLPLTSAVWHGPSLPAGAQIGRYIGTTFAVLKPEGGKRVGVLDSSLPLLGKTPDGASAPSDMRLVATGGGFSPASAAVALRIPQQASGALSFPDAAIGISLVGAASSSAQVAKDRVFFGNVLADSDLVLQAAPAGGGELSLVLRSPSSPSDYTLAFTLPAGESLAAVGPSSPLNPNPAPPGSVEIVNGARVVGLIKPAAGVDAQGTPISVSYRVQGAGQLVVHVDHSGDVAYPLYVDPEIDVFPNGNGWTDWAGYVNYPYWFYQGPSGGYDVAVIGAYPGTYPAFTPAQIYRPAVVDSFIYQAEFVNSSLTQLAYPTSYEYSGIFDANPAGCQGFAAGSWYATDNETPSSGTTCASHVHTASGSGWTSIVCAASCSPINTNILVGDSVAWGMTFWAQTAVASGTNGPFVGITGADTWSSDNYPPTIDSGNVAPDANWTQAIASTTLNLSLHDRGLGLSLVSVSDDAGANALSGTNRTQNAACQGAQPVDHSVNPPGPPAAPCPLSWTPQPITYYTTASTPEGRQNIVETVKDVAGNVTPNPPAAPTTFPIAIDHSPPSFGSFSGTLPAAAGQTPALLTSAVYGLSVPVSDAVSGVAHTTITVTPQGGTPQSIDQVNPSGADAAGMTATYAFNTAQHPRGINTIVLTAYDRANNQASSQTFTVDNDPSQGSQGDYSYRNQTLNDRMTLSENLGSGEALLSANDVAIAGPAGFGIALTRSYNSIETADATDLSPGWRFSLGGDVHLDTTGLPAGQIRYYGPTGETGIFVPSGANSYTDVAAIPAHLVRNADGTFTLSFYLTSATDTFGAANDSGRMNLQRATDRNANAVTIAYQGTTGAAANMMTQITETPNYPAAVSRSVTVHYLGNQISEIDDQTGRAWLYGYTSGRLTQYTDPVGGVTHYGYDAAGLLNTITDPLGSVTTVVYQTDGSARVATVTQPDGTPAKQVTGFAYPAGTGGYDETDVTDLNGYTAHNQVTSASTTPAARVGEVASSTDPTGVQSSHAFNANGRPSSGDVSGTGALTTTHYMPDGYRPDTITDPAPNLATTLIHYPTTGNTFLPDNVTDAQKNKLNLGYDGNGNLSSVIDSATPSHQPLNLTYRSDGVLATSTDVDAQGAQHVTGYKQNTAGDLTEVDPPAPLGSTTYTPDALGRVGSTTDGSGRTTAFTYDFLDRVHTATYTDGNPNDRTVLTYTYDLNGNQRTLLDPSGTTTYTPDLANRLVNVARPDGTQATYGYDKDNDLASTTDGLATSEAFTYDHADRLSQVTYINGSYTENYNYTYAFGTAQNGSQPLTQKTITYPNGILATSTYTSGLLVDLKYTGTAGTLRDFQYAYATNASCNTPGANQELIGQVTDQNQHPTRYCYDTLNRVTRATTYASDGVTVLHNYQYAYDPSGNRTSQTIDSTTTAYAYNPANELTSATPAGGTPRTFGYDGAGNQQTDSTGYSATYNVLSQTTGFSQGTNSLANTYTGAGQAQRTRASSETTYANTLLGVTSANANPLLGIPDFQSNNLATGQSSFIRDPTGNLLGLTTNTPGTLGNTITHYTYATDQQGSVSAIYNASQTQAAGYTYDPYGNTTTASGSTTTNPLTFQGQYQDTTGLYHMGQRYYSPVTGDWTQQDPVLQPTALSANRYAFAGDNPVNYVDPSGAFFLEMLVKKAYRTGEHFLFSDSLAADARLGRNILRVLGASTLLNVGKFTVNCARVLSGQNDVAGCDPIGNYLGIQNAQ